MKLTKRFLLGLFALLAFQTQGEDLFAQPPTLQGPIPFIMIISDTSASMEFTDKGSEYPHRTITTTPNLESLSSLLPGEMNAWVPSTFMDIDDADHTSGPTAFGPCLVWEPSECRSYERPSWNANLKTGNVGNPLNQDWKHEYSSSDTGLMRDRFIDYMRGSEGTTLLPDNGTGVRFHWEDQPRHVTIKEVLTGDMILRPNNAFGVQIPLDTLDRNMRGPGCWFVPRHRNASGQPEGRAGVDDKKICLNENNFEEFPDHSEPTPHFQEVYDGQLPNGLMDNLAGTAIFSVVGFDGYKKDSSWSALYNNSLNDELAGVSSGYAGLVEGTSCIDSAGNSSQCYDLGVFRIVAPKTLNIPSRFLPEVSRFSQVAVRDYGYLHEGGNSEWDLSPKSVGRDNERNIALGETYSTDFELYYDKQELGKQPIAAATPIAAAMQDLQGFFSSNPSNVPKEFSFGQGGNAITDDFAECRPKHVVLISDGAPSPERGEVNFTFDNNDGALSPYNTSEQEISDLVNDVNGTIEPPGSGFFPLSSVRVHVVGMNIGDDNALEKLTSMAIEGKTCAGFSLGANWHGTPTGLGGFTCPNKLLDPNNACLIPPSSGIDYPYPKPDGTTYTCKYPALILDKNDRDQLQAALSSLFNDIVDGASVSTRTRTVVTNEIQDDTNLLGGQHRVFSGVVTGGSQYWKGILNRQLLACDSTFDTVALHEEIGNQVNLTFTNKSDHRRIFTSLASDRLFNYSNRKPKINLGPSLFPSPKMFPSSFEFRKNRNGEDEFLGTQLSTTANETIGTRIPFEKKSIKDGLPSGMRARDLLGVSTGGRASEIINVFSGRIPEKVGNANGGILSGEAGRAFGGLLNSNPVIVGPPSLDLPIESYRQFKAHFADRHTMLYSNTMDGMLHAIHTGQREVMVRAQTNENDSPNADAPGAVEGMREAWAYIPQMFHNALDAASGSQSYLMDGTPTVADVRLCRARDDSNFSSLCRDSTTNNLEPWEQWKTVLVQGAGLAGTGYYAMDITRPGGRTLTASNSVVLNAPDPVPLWELTHAYENQQLKLIDANGDRDRIGSTATGDIDLGSCSGYDAFVTSTMLGTSISEPAIANILMRYVDTSNNSITEQRPVVVFGGGGSRPLDPALGCAPLGRALYVVDLQTGSIIRRFTSYFDAGTEIPFSTFNDPIEITGSPALFDGSPGSVATRGFVGGTGGRLFRMDFVSPNPTDWSVSLFFDPNTDSDVTSARSAAGTGGASFQLGPAGFKPAIASTDDKSVVVTYGLGDVRDTVTNNEAQLVIALKDNGSQQVPHIEWIEAFEPNEKLMGNPLTFDGVTYWSTYYLPTGDSCAPGRARIYGVNYLGDGSKVSRGVWDQVPSIVSASDILKDIPSTGIRWWGPEESTLIRGLTLTLGNPCNVDNIGTASPKYSDSSQRRPQLIAQTSGQDVATTLKNVNSNSGLGSASPIVDRLVVDIKAPDSKYQPLYWSAISY